MSKTTNALDTLHHYLKLAGRGEPFDDANCRRELGDAIETLKEFVAETEAAPRLGPQTDGPDSFKFGERDV